MLDSSIDTRCIYLLPFHRNVVCLEYCLYRLCDFSPDTVTYYLFSHCSAFIGCTACWRIPGINVTVYFPPYLVGWKMSDCKVAIAVGLNQSSLIWTISDVQIHTPTKAYSIRVCLRGYRSPQESLSWVLALFQLSSATERCRMVHDIPELPCKIVSISSWVWGNRFAGKVLMLFTICCLNRSKAAKRKEEKETQKLREG